MILGTQPKRDFIILNVNSFFLRSERTMYLLFYDRVYFKKSHVAVWRFKFNIFLIMMYSRRIPSCLVFAWFLMVLATSSGISVNDLYRWWDQLLKIIFLLILLRFRQNSSVVSADSKKRNIFWQTKNGSTYKWLANTDWD